MKSVFNFVVLLFAGLLLAGCASDRELRKLESSYKAQLGEYAAALKNGEITKAEHDKKVTQLNARYGRRRAMMERDIYGSGVKSPASRPMIGRGGRRY
jgi:outer membrane biogenesis lipoprotein LolB